MSNKWKVFMRKGFFTFLCILWISFFIVIYQLWAKPIKVVVSGYALEKVIKEACPFLKFEALLPPHGEFHSFEPSLSQWKAIKEADLVILVGTEPWAEKVFSLRKKGVLSLLKKGEKVKDPHLWFDLSRIETLVINLKNFLKKNAPEAYAACDTNFGEFLKNLSSLKARCKALKNCQKREIFILGHPVFSYLFKGAGIEQVTLVKGHFHQAEPGMKSVAELLKRIKTSGEDTIFLTDPDFAKFEKFFRTRGIRVEYLWSGDTYHSGSFTDLLESNLLKIKKVLKCQN